MRKVLLSTKAAYKYGMPFLLLFCFFTFLIKDNENYSTIYTYINESVGVSLLFCYRELFEAYRRNKCKWQKTSIYGLTLFCINNIIFVGNYSHFLYFATSYLILGVSLLIVIYYILHENYES
jgi:hypothetical protein